MKELRITKEGSSYLNNTGAYQKELDFLYAKMVPHGGAAITLNGELIRAISRLFYEYANNGNCNARNVVTKETEERCWSCNGRGYVNNDGDDTCGDCEGSGTLYDEEELEPELDEFFERFLTLIEKTVPNISNEIEGITTLILTKGYKCNFGNDEMKHYNILSDKVMHYVLNNADKQLPEWYEGSKK